MRGTTFLTKSTDLIYESCCNCGIWFAMPRPLYKQRSRDGKTFYCPNGHPQHYTETDAVQLERAEARVRHLDDQLQASKQEAEARRRDLVRERNRFANGVCPCCNRSFTDVRRHMETKHPNYDPSDLLPFACTCGRRFTSYQGLRIHQGHRRTSSFRHETKV